MLDALHRTGPTTVGEIVAAMTEPATYAAVRAALRMLEQKGQVRHRYDGPRYLYEPTVATETASRQALEHLVATFFNGSVKQAMAALVDLPQSGLSPGEHDELSKLIDDAEREGR